MLNLNEKGISLAETLLIILSIGFIVILLASLPNSMGLISKSRHVSLAREIASKQIEDKRSVSYANLVKDTVQITPSVDSRISLLPSGAGTIVVDDCNIQNICTNGEHIKQVNVTVTWKENLKNQSITLKTLIGEGGLNQ